MKQTLSVNIILNEDLIRKRIDKMISRKVTKITKKILKDMDLLGVIREELRKEAADEN